MTEATSWADRTARRPGGTAEARADDPDDVDDDDKAADDDDDEDGPNDRDMLDDEDDEDHHLDDAPDHEDRDDDDDDEDDDDEDEDPFNGRPYGGPGRPPPGIASTLRALSGIMSGLSSRLREILANLQRKDDDSMRLIALQELAELLLVSTEDHLAGHFSPDPFVKELVNLMEPAEFGVENPEMMLLACRCIANLMEALPSSTANVVYGGAVPILCQKLLEIHYIDLAEQALSVSFFSFLLVGSFLSPPLSPFFLPRT